MFAPSRTLLSALALTCLTSFAASAGSAHPLVSSGIPPVSSLMAFRHVTATGTTKPPGAALDDRGGTSMTLAAADLRVKQLVRSAICRGC